jgi:hypothetical protein
MLFWLPLIFTSVFFELAVPRTESAIWVEPGHD